MKTFFNIIFCCFITMNTFSQTSLVGIEDKINQAFGQCFIESNDEALLELITDLESVKEDSEKSWTNYWLSYAKINLALYHMNASKKNNEVASKSLQDAINTLEDIKDKNTEEYTLLARALGISINLDPSSAMSLSSKSGSAIKKAMKLNNKNLRAYLQSGSSDFYTPVEYGGGKIAESQFLKALTLPDKAIDEANAPTWGRDEVYYMLVSFYLREENYDQAKIFLNKGLKQFPENKRLQSLSAKI